MKFADKVKAKGFFHNCEPGTVAYQERYLKVIEKYRDRMETTASTTTSTTSNDNASTSSSSVSTDSKPTVVPSKKENDETLAEKLKAQGNEHLTNKRFQAAVQSYTEAIEAAPTGKNVHIYYANRSAAYFSAKDFNQAVQDARTCVATEPSYTKGYNRLATALEEQGNINEAIAAYEKCLDIDPDNATAKEQLPRLRNKQGSSLRSSSSSSSSTGSNRSSNNRSGFGGGNGPSSPGGMPGMPDLGGLGGIMNNPMFASMAANLMKDPNALSGLMNNPMVQQMMAGLGGGGGMGGMPGMGGMGSGGNNNASMDSDQSPEIEELGDDDEPVSRSGSSSSDSTSSPRPNIPNNLPPEFAGLANDPELASYMTDPDVQAMMADVQREGMGAAMRYMGKPGVMKIISKVMGKMGKK